MNIWNFYLETNKIFEKKEHNISKEEYKSLENFFKKYNKFLNFRFFIANFDRDNKMYIFRKDNITRYINYCNKLEQDIESCESYIKESLNFVKDFCVEKNITIGEYIDYVDKDSVSFSWMKHIMERRVSKFIFLFFEKMYKKLLQMDEEYAKYYVGDLSTIRSIITKYDLHPLKKELIKIIK